MPTTTSRRRFLKTTAALAAATGLPAWYVDECMAQQQPAPKSPNEKPNLALIGCGGQGTGDARNAANFGNIVAVCDVDKSHLANAQKIFKGAEGFTDFRKLLERKDIDAVICGTVDHWHTFVSLAAMKAGKDIYCEKPLTLTIDEGRHVVAAQQETKRILQVGTQQRSSARFRLACDAVRNGRLGKITKVEVWLPAGLRGGPFRVSQVPPQFDFETWKGQTPDVPYVKERTHFSFRYWWDYSGGTMTDWGAHHNDIVSWCLDLEAPTSIEGKELIAPIPGGYTAASQYAVTYTYPSGLVHTCNSTLDSEWNGATKNKNGQLHGIKFIGENGWIWVTRDALTASDRSFINQQFPADAKRLYVSNNHMGNFIECIKSRQEPIAPASAGHRSATICHLGVISIRLGRKLTFDPATQQFQSDDQANALIARPMRKPFDYTYIA